MSFDPEKVQRYDFEKEPDGYCYMDEWELGEYVKYEDYAQLLALLHEVSTEADPAGTLRENIVLKETVKALEIENEELKAEIKALKGEGYSSRK